MHGIIIAAANLLKVEGTVVVAEKDLVLPLPSPDIGDLVRGQTPDQAAEKQTHSDNSPTPASGYQKKDGTYPEDMRDVNRGPIIIFLHSLQTMI